MAFQKGQSGNPSGRPKSKPITEAIELALKRFYEGDPQGRTMLQKAVDEQTLRAADGDLQAFQWLTDRLEGRAKQQTEVTGADDGPVQIVIRVE